MSSNIPAVGKQTYDQMLAAAEKQVGGAGARVTTTRVRVLAALMASGQALSHHDVEGCFGSGEMDRVTLYRVLDWLVAQGLAHRVAGADRVWRYSVLREVHDQHAHFECNSCGKVVCLGEVSASRLRLPVPRGYRSEAVELTVKGHCAQCR